MSSPELPSIPPVFRPLDEAQLEADYLLELPDRLPIHTGYHSMQFWERHPQPQRLLHAQMAPVSTTLNVDRNMATGAVLGFNEVSLLDAGTTAKNSTSLRRAPGPPDESTRGSSTNYPFWPGGFDQDDDDEPGQLLPEDTAEDNQDLSALDDPSQYVSVPPGFVQGLDFTQKTSGSLSSAGPPVEVLNLASVLISDEDALGIWSDDIQPKTDEKKDDKATPSPRGDKADPGVPEGGSTDDLDAILPDASDDTAAFNVVKIADPSASPTDTSTEWAEVVDISRPMSDFHQKVPQMAFTWPFELDTFQKQAIFRLEQNQSVFVAAHTSAGKTVVAEYAIALSQKHMTRTIYTSPIKALSNQKFRDFKDTFNDVGLVTGDIQINPTATCLIMTTEILRSMLYNGSDIIRDLEYVIFDEVHYINDKDRGVVWEEVLILLPDHVNIIMLSATVPNTVVFADWVGRTKKKKIYVITTLKRPVPLEHYLYTGTNGKTRDDRILIQDASGTFRQDNYKKAVMLRKEQESKNKSKQQFGAKGVRDRVNLQQEKNIWLTVIDHLSRMDKLPVVAFTLSRNRCDQYANLLTSLDLTTSVEKSDIHHFIQRCVQRLKGADRRLPQVIQLTELLKRGIGIHHSGILPILKEVVEMLFQKGWVKLLFATETFAMGVNMPARTVVFDNIRKHDGVQFRTLLPAEYIQMAGRAGRRGLDSTGTVIILCKAEIHDLTELHGMMKGKPTQLESKFRLTYSMILNLLRVEQLRVQDMMKRSFREIDTQRKQKQHKQRLVQIKTEMEQLPQISTSMCGEELETFYAKATQYLEKKSSLWTLLLSHPVALKLLTPGRVLVVNHGKKVNRLALLLSVDTKSRVKTYAMMVLHEDTDETSSVVEESKEEQFLQYLTLVFAVSAGHTFGISPGYDIIDITDSSILDITTKLVKVDADKILTDVKKREIPRFKNDPPGQSTTSAFQELAKFVDQSQHSSAEVELVSLVKDFKVQDIDLLNQLKHMQTIREEIAAMSCAETIPDFAAQFGRVFHRMQLEQELKDTEFLMSEESLMLLPDYYNRIEVLKSLKYVGGENSTVRLKGRVACEMGSHELMITELVFDNVLTDRPPGEIAALLSCTVFQQRNCSAPELTDSLKKGVEDIKRVAKMLGNVQKECGMAEAPGDYVEQFHFGLVEVVYEWARGMPFAEITQLTDVQEGVIVRAIQRLDETLRDVKDAARVIGDTVLYQKMDEASTIIKRDIVFAASLYTQ